MSVRRLACMTLHLSDILASDFFMLFSAKSSDVNYIGRSRTEHFLVENVVVLALNLLNKA